MADPEIFRQHSKIEYDSAKRLAESLKPWRFSVPKGPILEVGAGTGHLTQHLADLFPKRSFHVADKSPQMLQIAEDNLRTDEASKLSFSIFDPEQDNIKPQHYALISGNYVAHQFTNPALTLERLALGLKLDGYMILSFPGEDSFGEWRSTCLDLGIPYTAKPMPETEPTVIHLSMGPVQVDFYEDQSKGYFQDFNSFLSHMKAGGFDVEKNDRKLSTKEISLLDENWAAKENGALAFTFHNVFLAIKRIGE